MSDTFTVSVYDDENGALIVPRELLDEADSAKARAIALAIEYPEQIVEVEHVPLIKSLSWGKLIFRADANGSNVVMDHHH